MKASVSEGVRGKEPEVVLGPQREHGNERKSNVEKETAVAVSFLRLSLVNE
jgi:hypothetical protein